MPVGRRPGKALPRYKQRQARAEVVKAARIHAVQGRGENEEAPRPTTHTNRNLYTILDIRHTKRYPGNRPPWAVDREL